MRLTLDNENFGDQFDSFLRDCYQIDIHNSEMLMQTLTSMEEKFKLEDNSTLYGILGSLIMNMVYFKQMLDGNHFQLSTHDGTEDPL